MELRGVGILGLVAERTASRLELGEDDLEVLHLLDTTRESARASSPWPGFFAIRAWAEDAAFSSQ